MFRAGVFKKKIQIVIELNIVPYVTWTMLITVNSSCFVMLGRTANCFRNAASFEYSMSKSQRPKGFFD